jgi:hypothetical protein
VSVTLIIEHAKCMIPIIFQSTACLALQYFATSYKWYEFEKNKMLLNIKCVFWFYLKLLSEIFIIPRRILRSMIINVKKGLPVEYRLLLFSGFKET